MKDKQHNERLAYIIIGATAVIMLLAHELIGNNHTEPNTAQEILLNVGSDTLAIGILYFLLNKLLLQKDDTLPSKIEEQNEKFDEGFNLTIKEVINTKSKLESKINENSSILKAIRDESTLSDKVVERIEINEKLQNLSTKLETTKKMLTEKEKEQERRSRNINEQLRTFGKQMENLETRINRAHTEMQRELKTEQNTLVNDFQQEISSEKAIENVQSELSRTLPAIINQKNIHIQPKASRIITKQAVETFTNKVAEKPLNNLNSNLANSSDKITSEKIENLIEVVQALQKQIENITREAGKDYV